MRLESNGFSYSENTEEVRQWLELRFYAWGVGGYKGGQGFSGGSIPRNFSQTWNKNKKECIFLTMFIILLHITLSLHPLHVTNMTLELEILSAPRKF